MNAAVNAATTATLTGGAGADTLIVNASGATTLTLDGAGAGDTFTVNFGGLGGTVAIADGGGSAGDQAFVNGTAAANTFEVNTTAAGGANTVRFNATVQRATYTGALEAMTLDAGDLGDTYNVQFGNSLLPGSFAIADGGASGTDTANLFGTAAADSFNVNTAAAQTVAFGATGEVASYTANLEQLSVNGPLNPLEGTPQTPSASDAGDTFVVTPDAATVITINGGNPTAGTGDTLVLNAAPLTAPIAITDPIGTPGSNALPHGRITSGNRQTVFWNSIETLPVPLGLGGTFDFQPVGSPTQAGFLPVTSADTPTSGAYAAAQVGWVNAGQGSFDRVVTFGAAGNPNSPQLQSLLRDGQWGNYGGGANNGLFQVAVAPGTLPSRLVQVTAYVGDVYFGRDTMNVYVRNLTTGLRTKLNPNLAALNTASGPHQFVSYGGMIDPGDTPTSGSTKVLLQIEIEAVAGGASTFWTIEGVDVRPLGLIAPLTITPPTTPREGDGTTVDVYTGTGAAPGAELTISPQLGTPAGVDADPSVKGFQVVADSAGAFAFSILRPSGSGSSIISVRDVTGASATGFLDPTAADPGAATPNPYLMPNPYTQVYTAPTSPPPPATVSVNYDFNSGASPTQAGFTGVQAGDAYSVGLGRGWVGGASGYDRGAGSSGTPVDLYRDGAWGTGSSTFQVALPAGSYDVRVYVGDPYSPWAGITVTAGSQTVAVDSAANRFGYVTLYGVASSGGVLGVTMTAGGSGIWVASGIQIASAGTLPAPATPAATVLSGVQRLDINGVSADTAAGFTAATGAPYTTGVGYGWQGAVPTFERAASPVPTGLTAAQWQLYRDAAYGGPAPGTFQFAVPQGAGNTYAARIYVGDSYNNWPGITLQMEGGPLVNVNTSANPFWSYLLSGSDANGDGVVTITVRGQVWVVNGIDMVQTAGTSVGVLPASAGPGAAPQLAAEGAATPGGAATLTAEQLAPVAAEAVRRWEAAGLSASQLALLRSATFEIGDLGGHLGLTSIGGNLVRLDDDGAGRGWFVDSTPRDDAEYASGLGLTQLSATDRSATRGYDLLTVVMHELGHTLGLDSTDAAGTLMSAALAVGTRRVPTPSDAPVKLWLAEEAQADAGTWDAPATRSATPPAAEAASLPAASQSALTVVREVKPLAPALDDDAWTFGGISVE